MAYIKVIKTNSYYSRFQVKYRRRREGKTDYRARLRLVTQDKNKYNTPKYRLIVRYTNKDIICQIAYATIAGDVTVCSAYAHELPSYGLKVGLNNYAAGYCVGLLVARRCLAKFHLDKHYVGQTEPDGTDFTVEPAEDGPRPMTVILDTGLKRTSTGSKVFACLKGALDGGLNIPHNHKRFVGYDNITKEFDDEVLKSYIFGQHVAEYMEELREEEPDAYRRLFSGYIKSGVKPDDLEDIIEKTHANIRANPVRPKKARKAPAGAPKIFNMKKITYKERKDRLKAKLASLMG